MNFWEKALAEEKARGRWQRWRSPVSLAVQMIIVALIAIATAGPQVPAPKRMVLIIDNSATMRATDVPPTRLDAAKITALRLIESLRECDEMAVVAVCPTPWEVQPLTSDKSLLAGAIYHSDLMQARPEPPAIDWSVKLAREISMPDNRTSRIVLITDACSKEAAKRAQDSGVEVLRVGTAASNLAITCFAVRRTKADPAKCEAFVEVRNQSDRPAQGTVTIAFDPNRLPGGGWGSMRSGPSAAFSILTNDLWRHVFSLDLPTAARLTAWIAPDDAYIFDDTAVLDVPAVAPRRLDGQSPWKDEILSTRGQRDIGPMSPIGDDIRVPADIGSDAAALVLDKPAPPLWLAPAVVAAALVIIEWCLYQRRWTA